MIQDLPNEIWKDIEGYEGFYQISNTGKVRSLDRKLSKSNGVIERRRGQLMSLIKDKDGYMRVGLRNIDSKRYFGVQIFIILIMVQQLKEELILIKLDQY